MGKQPPLKLKSADCGNIQLICCICFGAGTPSAKCFLLPLTDVRRFPYAVRAGRAQKATKKKVYVYIYIHIWQFFICCLIKIGAQSA